MIWKTLTEEVVGSVLRVTLNRPHVANAQSQEMIRELDRLNELASRNPDIKVIVLAGAGKHFSSGHDLGSREEVEYWKEHPLPETYSGEWQHRLDLYLDACVRWRDLPKPTIAEVHGHCIMGGLMLASACDIIVASEDALFADRSVGTGSAHVQYFSLPWDVGARKAKEMLFTGGFMTAVEAERRGFVNRVYPRASLSDEAMALAAQISRQDAFALRMAKRSVNDTLDIQGQRQALHASFNGHMVTLASRREAGVSGGSLPGDAKERFAKMK